MPLEDKDFNELISELSTWNGGSGISAEVWVGYVGNYDLAIGYSLIFWPQFVVIDGYVFRQYATKKLFDHWWFSTNGNALAVQSVINHFHLTDLHFKDAHESQILYLGRILKQTYEAKLKLEFPDRTFMVIFNDEPGLDLLSYELTFWQL